MDLLAAIAMDSWAFLVESAPYLLVGFLAAGLLHGFVSERFVAEHLGKGRFKPVFKAAILGIPLPICSCGVVPAAMGLRAKGATKGATISFMVSTPENGVDSMAVTYALMDPLMAVLRPLAALVSAVSAGLLETLSGNEEKVRQGVTCADRCCGNDADGEGLPFAGRVRHGMNYAFGELLRDLLPWLFVGILLAGVISALIPDGWIETYIGRGFGSLLAMLAFGIPMYVCATASTPIAAALVLKGLSPGAALVLLLSGPATNPVSLAALSRMIGFRATTRYLAGISVVTLCMGWLTDRIYEALGLAGTASIHPGAGVENHYIGVAGVVVLAVLSVRAFMVRRNPCSCA